MLKRASIGFAMLSLASAASAQWEATVGYSNVDLDWATLGAMTAGVGYRIPINDTLSITPGARIGYGINNEAFPLSVGANNNGEPVTVVAEGEVEIGNFYGLQLRGQFDFENGVYLFAAPSYSALELDMSSEFGSSSYDDSGFGMGAGAGMRFNDFFNAEVSYEKMDFAEADVLGIHARFTF